MSNYKILMSFFLVLLSAIPFSNGVSEQNEISEHTHYKLPLWTAKKDGAVYHILGTTHVGSAELYPLHETIIDKFMSSDEVVDATSVGCKCNEEVDEDNLAKKTLHQRVDSNTRKHLKDYILKIQNPKILKAVGRKLQTLSPLSAQSQILRAEYLKLGFTRKYDMAYHFLELAEKHNKSFCYPGLEVDKSDFSGNKKHYSTQEMNQLILHYSLIAVPHLTEEMDKVYDAWYSANITRLQDLMMWPEELYGPIDKKFQQQYRHNNITVPAIRIAKAMREDVSKQMTQFVLVSASVLAGDDGLLTKLKELGFSIEQATSTIPMVKRAKIVKSQVKAPEGFIDISDYELEQIRFKRFKNLNVKHVFMSQMHLFTAVGENPNNSNLLPLFIVMENTVKNNEQFDLHVQMNGEMHFKYNGNKDALNDRLTGDFEINDLRVYAHAGHFKNNQKQYTFLVVTGKDKKRSTPIINRWLKQQDVFTK